VIKLNRLYREVILMGKHFKKAAAILLAAVIMVPSASFSNSLAAANTEAADTEVTADAEAVAAAGEVTELVKEDFEGATFATSIQGRGAAIQVTKQSDTNHELTISGRTSDWNGMQIPVTTVTGTAITVSMKVRSANTGCVLGIQYIPGGSTKEVYKWIMNQATTADNYAVFSGSYNIPQDASEVKLYLQGEAASDLENIMVDDILVTIPKASTGPTTTAVEDFEGVTHRAIARGAVIAVVDGAGVGGSKALLVSERKESWQGVNFDAAAYAGQTVSVSAQVKGESSSIKISIQIGEGSGASYKQVAAGAGNGNEYVTLSGDYNIPSGTTPIYLYVETNDTKDFYVDNFSITASKEPEKTIQEDLLPLKTHMASVSAIAGTMGVAIPASALEDKARMSLVAKHYNSITCENEMKPESLLGSAATLDASGNPVLNFTNADKIMDYILNYNKVHQNDPIRVRGHVLLWHSQTPGWFFREGYSADGAYVSKEVMLERMDYYFKNVIAHYDAPDSKYKGLIYAWDVVNEQIDNGGIRVSDGGAGISNWYQVFQGDNIYIKEAFRLANLYAPSNVKLFYNDYGETDPVKAEAICKLIQEIKTHPGTRIDGMGMQGHYNMSSPAIDTLEKAVRKYAAVVGEIQITELDLQSSTDYDGTNQEQEYTKQAYRYKAVFDKLSELDREEGIDITSVTMWGTHDGASWLQSSSSVGGGADGRRKQCPLLFDDDYQAKPAYYAIVDPSKLEPFTNRAISLHSEQENWTAAPKTAYTSDGTEVAFWTLWNKDGMKVLVEVKDSTAAEGDGITVYVDEANTKSPSGALKQYSLMRGGAAVTEGGYRGIITVPLDQNKVGKVIGFDVAVMNNGRKLSWNDLKDTQETTSKYYGEIILKPYARFNYGTPSVDGNLDTIWQSQTVLPLTIKTGSPEAAAEVRALWDDTCLYVFAEVTDPKLSKTNSNAWEQDSLEIFLDRNGEKSSAYEEDDCQYRINYDNQASFNGVKCNEQHLKSVTRLTDHGYIVEAAIQWTDVVPVNGTVIGVDFQINDDAGAGSRAGTCNWYDETGTGYANPSVFGAVTLLKSASEGNNPGGNNGGNNNNNNGKPKEEDTAPKAGEGAEKGNSGDTGEEIKVSVKTWKEAAKESAVVAKLLNASKIQGACVAVAKTTQSPEQMTVSLENVKAGSKVYVYRVNDTTGKLETIAFGYTHKIDKEGKVSFSVLDGGTYLILTEKADRKLITPLRDQIKVSAVKTLKAGGSAELQIELPSSLELAKSLSSQTASLAAGAVTASYQVNDKAIATVDKSGRITAKKAGKVTITTTVKLYNNTTKTFKTVINITK
jgi:GH35 family endo-1,4-beta-xylanase